MKKFILSFFCLSFILNANSQNSFSTEPPVFIDEFAKFMGTPSNPELKPIIETFVSNWKSGKILPEQKTYIIKISNSMIYKNLPKDPYFDLLLKNLDLFYQKKLSSTILKQWQDITKAQLEKNSKDYLAFLQVAYDLFKDNTLVRIDKRRWYASNANFEFTFEKNRVGISFKNLDLICEAALDKIKVLNCSGVFYPDKKTWSGTQGRINWTRVGKPESEIYCEFKK
ncbi:MAG TPA: hypothetical protein VGF79_12775, partial [Bacteroidia bacterium]